MIFRHKNGGIRWGRVSVVPLITESGILVGARGIVHDITKQKNQQRLLEIHLKHLHQEKYFQTIIRYVLQRFNQEIDPYPILPKILDFFVLL